ncbi:S9 family peptidase [Luteimonas aquatica]|uniref:S9 family peptidase n=1 Tax=Luteimonas aquatica TaxID=450364 RepID=UPI001F59E59E|nr:S9 family peptidase [Luteimonas aquatica]
MLRPSNFCLVLLLTVGANAAAQPPDLARIMADPDWIGPPVEQAWWSWDGQQAYYTLKRDGGSIRDTYAQRVDGGAAARLDGAALAGIDGAQQAIDPAGTRMAFVRNGDLFVRELRGSGPDSGKLVQLTRSEIDESRPQWSVSGALVWRAGEAWFRWTARDGVSQASNLKAEDDPAKPPPQDELRARQLRYIATLREDKARQDAAREQEALWHKADASRAAAAVYLGKDVAIVDSVLSPEGRWLIAVTRAKDADEGEKSKLPKYVTASGYEEVEEARTRVGRNPPAPQKAWLVDVANASARELTFDALPGVREDPLAALRKAAGKPALQGDRDLYLTSEDFDAGSTVRWSADGRHVALMLRAIDNKDRWIAEVDLTKATLLPRHRLHDPAWINWDYNDFGWTREGRLWLQSEQSGYSHLYLLDAGRGGERALTSGRWEVSAPVLSPDGRTFYFLCNRQAPGDYEVCSVPAGGGEVREITAFDGVEGFALSPDGGRLLVRHSASYVPAQLAVVEAGGGQPRELTDTRKPAYKALDWIAPEIVQVPSRHGAGKIWGKYYGPERPEPGRKYPIVMFVHGAGYLQNVSARYPNYFREQMFHNLLVARGFVVLDLDYRASQGYGRDWRTAIYRNMGHPELEDYLDGLEWLVAEKQGDRDRAGIYGGSYGGFMTFMALFRAPGVFKAGAALRPVSDWSQYNHGYTSAILNTPELDPEAYKASSPMEYAEGLRDHLLIAHGMLDDNVFFRDSVMLTQKLIELRKDKWELAPYPLERHSFTHPDSWYDEYRRIDELFERTLK